MSLSIMNESTVRRIVGISGTLNKKILWHGNTLNIKQFLKLDEYTEIIKEIIEDITSPDGLILYELIDFAKKINIIKYYSLIELPTEADILYYIVCGTDLYDTIVNNVNKYQINSINNSIDLLISRCTVSDNNE